MLNDGATTVFCLWSTIKFLDLKFSMVCDKDDTSKLSFEHLSDGSGITKLSVINPFKHHYMASTVTLFKHRWLHAFPLNMKGIIMQEHHQRVITDDLEPAAKVCLPLSFIRNLLVGHQNFKKFILVTPLHVRNHFFFCFWMKNTFECRVVQYIPLLCVWIINLNVV